VNLHNNIANQIAAEKDTKLNILEKLDVCREAKYVVLRVLGKF
jgi:hypothetical protein